MQAVIMAAGFGRRLGSLTESQPKSLLKLNNETLIERAIRQLNERGVHEIHVVTGFQNDVMRKKLAELAQCHFNPLYYCTNVLASFAVVMPYIHSDFIFLHADTVVDPEIVDELVGSSSDVVLPIDYGDVDEEAMKVIVNSNGHVSQISKEIQISEASGEFIGMAKISKDVFPSLEDAVMCELKDKKLVQSYFEGALQNLIDRGAIFEALDISELNWSEIDFEEDYVIAKNLFES